MKSVTFVYPQLVLCIGIFYFLCYILYFLFYFQFENASSKINVFAGTHSLYHLEKKKINKLGGNASGGNNKGGNL